MVTAIQNIMKDVWEKHTERPKGYTLSRDAIARIVRRHYDDDSTDTQRLMIELVESYYEDVNEAFDI